MAAKFLPAQKQTRQAVGLGKIPCTSKDVFLKKISKNIGRPVKVDTTTSLVSIGRFARVCVELDLSKPLLAKFTLEGEVVPIEYEGIQMVCFNCGLYGHKQGQCEMQEQGEEKGSMNENQTQDHQENPQTNGDNRTAQQSRGPKRDYKQNFGDWMLVARKERRNFRKGGPRVPTTTGNNQYQMPFMNAGGPQLQSRYAVLDGLEEKEMEFLPEERPSSATMQNVLTTLPRIRTTQNQNSPRGQNIPQQGGRYQTNQGGRGLGGGQMAHYERGTTRGRGTRGGAPRRAAAESEHIVVRGSNRRKQIASSVVHHMNDRPEPSRRMDVDYELLGDPPDVPRLFENRPDKPGTSEMNEEGHMDPGGEALIGSQCYWALPLIYFCFVFYD